MLIVCVLVFQANIGLMDTAKDMWNMIMGNLALIQVKATQQYRLIHSSASEHLCPCLHVCRNYILETNGKRSDNKLTVQYYSACT